MDWQAEITAAAGRIAPYLRITPVMETALPGAGQIALKLENTQHTGSFKARGAFNTLVAGPVPKAGVVAASGGNHGAAVAFAARTLGYPAKIFVPEYAGPAKIALIRAQGADLVVVPGVYADAAARAADYAAETGAMAVDGFPLRARRGSGAGGAGAQPPSLDDGQPGFPGRAVRRRGTPGPEV